MIQHRLLPAPKSLLLALLVFNFGVGSTARAQDAGLQSATQLPETLDSKTRKASPSFLRADQVISQPNGSTRLQGQVEIRRADVLLKADQVTYDRPSDTVEAKGQVIVNRAGNVFKGPELTLEVNAFEGQMQDPVYEFLRTKTGGYAKRIDFLGPNKLVAHEVVYSSCQPGRAAFKDWAPDWFLKASSVTMDNEADEGLVEGGKVYFKGIPVFWVPEFGFPLSDKRRSGFLPPSVVIDNTSGYTVAIPYYWNLAPNRDLIITPEQSSKRGNRIILDARQLNALQPLTRGTARLEYMPKDLERDMTDRWGLSVSQVGELSLGNQTVRANLAINQVSDDHYWQDFTGAPGFLSQRVLPSTLNLDTALDWANLSVNTAKWQVLQQPDHITPPYDLLPQATLTPRALGFSGVTLNSMFQASRFQSSRLYDCQLAPDNLACQPNAARSLAKLTLARPFLASYGYFTPSLQIQSRHYSFDRTGLEVPVTSRYIGLDSQSVTVPTLKLDGGLFFDRTIEVGGHSLLQTLEPRLIFAQTPYVAQSHLPLYDTGLADLNNWSIFSPNVFSGEDRISDGRMVIAGLSSRFVEPGTGAQWLKLSMAQRYRFTDQRVGLYNTDAPLKERLSDVMLGANVALDNRAYLDVFNQYNPSEQRSMRSIVNLRYRPENYKVFNASYSQQRTTDMPNELFNTSWQWPVSPLNRAYAEGYWYSVGRLNYSPTDRRMVNTTLGMEYDAGCWVGRVVVDRQQLSANSFNQRLMFELELSGMSRLGISPLNTLKQNIQGYQPLHSLETPSPSRFDRYE